MSHHYTGPDWGFPLGDARVDLTDLYAFPKPGDSAKSILIMNVHPREGRSARRRLEPHPRDRRVQSRRSERERRLEGAGDVELSGHELATVAALPVREVVLAIHVIADLSLGEAEVAHDHLANRQSTDRQSTGKVRRSG
jgi:hypothetical protein